MQERKALLQLSFLAVILLVGSCVQDAQNPFSEADRAALKSLDQSYAQAWLGLNAESDVMKLFADDAVIIPHHGDQPQKGKNEIRDFFWPKDYGPTQILEFVREPAEADGFGDLGYVRGRFSLKFSFELDGEIKTFSNEGNYLLVAERLPGQQWQIARLIWNDPVPEIQ